jgi:RNA-directed DNA polymerase
MNNTRLLEDLFQAYYSARKGKRNTINQLKFELNFEHNIFTLRDEIESRSYKPSREIAFIINKPVKREIFAADFRDRVVHHLLFKYLNPVVEKYLIYDCYSCRKGKGTSAGIKRAAKFLRSCSDSYQKDCYIMQMDISGYFMSIDRDMLHRKIESILQTEYHKRALSGQAVLFDKNTLDFLLQKTIFHDPVDNCIIRTPRSGWDGLPDNKSLFCSLKGCGLPIGNLTSQLFGNVFLNDFDHWMKKSMGFQYYGRYVDDFFVMHQDKACLLKALPKIADYLKTNEALILHPNKTKISRGKTGVLFLGVYVKPHRAYISNRTKGNFYQAIEKQNKIMRIRRRRLTIKEKSLFISSMNSYLGIMKHYKTRKLIKKMIKIMLLAGWWRIVFVKGCYNKFGLNNSCRLSA